MAACCEIALLPKIKHQPIEDLDFLFRGGNHAKKEPAGEYVRLVALNRYIVTYRRARTLILASLLVS